MLTAAQKSQTSINWRSIFIILNITVQDDCSFVVIFFQGYISQPGILEESSSHTALFFNVIFKDLSIRSSLVTYREQQKWTPTQLMHSM